MAQYISKDILVAKIEKRLEERQNARDIAMWNDDYWPESDFCIRDREDEELLTIINTLEVKEVDLDKELVEEVYAHIDSIKDTADRMTSGNFMHNRAAIKFSANTIAKVLELMGLKVQKEE